jgi:hypothetical protein
MSLTPTLPDPIHVICLCACSFLHPGKPNICDYGKPVAVTSTPERTPLCKPCADALGVPLLANERGQ